MYLVLGLLMPFLGTTLGSALVFFMKDKLNKNVEKFLLGFASGVMISASFFSLLLPSINMSKIKWIAPSIGFIFGILFLLLLDNIIPHLHLNSNKQEGIESKLKKTTMMVLAVTLHNVPEGMAVGVILSAFLNGSVAVSSALALSLGIAIQNFSE